MRIRDMLTVERIVVGVEARSKKRALEHLSGVLASGVEDLGQAAVFTSLVGRERLGSTAIGHGVALPHGRVEGVTTAMGALLRLAEPVDFEADDGAPVDMLFGMLVPVDCGDEHLAALASVASVFDDADMRDRLRRASGPDQLLELMSGAVPGD
jgi:nitrogen PTS system EIIA component